MCLNYNSESVEPHNIDDGIWNINTICLIFLPTKYDISR